MMCGRSRACGTYRPTHHPAGVALAAGLALAASGADALHAPVWADAAARCFAAIDQGFPIDPGPFTLRVVTADEGSDWPEQSRGQGLVEIWQGAVRAGGEKPARYCEVRYGARPGPAEIAEVTGLYVALQESWIAKGYKPRIANRTPDLGSGLLSELFRPAPNPRGCRVTVSFLSAPEVGIVSFSVSEIARQPCGTRVWEGQ